MDLMSIMKALGDGSLAKHAEKAGNAFDESLAVARAILAEHRETNAMLRAMAPCLETIARAIKQKENA